MRTLMILLLSIPLFFACDKDDNAPTDWYVGIRYDEASSALRPASVNIDVIDPGRNSITSFEKQDANTWLYKIPGGVDNVLVKVSANIDGSNVDNAVALKRSRTTAYNSHAILFGYSETGVFIPTVAVAQYDERTGVVTARSKTYE